MKWPNVKYYSAVLRGVWGAGLVGLPLFYWPESVVPFEVPKGAFLALWVGLLMILLVIGAVIGLVRFKMRTFRWLDGLTWLGLYLVVMTLAAWLGVDWDKSVRGNFYRVDGLVTMWLLLAVAVVGRLTATRFGKKVTLKAILLGAVISSIWAVVDAVRWYGWQESAVSGWGGAQGAGFGQPVFLAGYLVVCLPLVSYLLSDKKFRFWVYGLLAAGIIASQAWGGVVGLVVYGLMKLPRRKALLGLVMLTMSILVWFGLKPKSDDFVAESRERIFRRAIMGWQERPWLGWGVANVDKAIENQVWPYPVLQDKYIDKAHSTALEVLVTGGLVGLGVWVGLNGYVLKKLWDKDRTLLMVLILYLIHTQTNVTSVSEDLIWWLVVGMG